MLALPLVLIHLLEDGEEELVGRGILGEDFGARNGQAFCEARFAAWSGLWS